MGSPTPVPASAVSTSARLQLALAHQQSPASDTARMTEREPLLRRPSESGANTMCACCAPALLVDYEDFASAPQVRVQGARFASVSLLARSPL